MCGIVAFYGKKEEILPVLISGLKRLEYRGYDSSGLAITTANSDIYCQKAVGKVSELEKQIELNNIPDFNMVGIAHTRWATHGVPSLNNAHPHSSRDKQLYLIHNGIIENYKQLKAELVELGYEFYGETDTEILVNLVHKNYQIHHQETGTWDLKEAVLMALKRVKGAYAICVISKDEPTRLIAAKQGSPLVLGVGQQDFILASDATPIINKTRSVIYLEDGELVDIQNGTYNIISSNNQLQNKKIEQIDWDDEMASKNGFEHFLIKEIMEQDQSVLESCRGRLLVEEGNIKFGGLMDIQERLRTINKVVLLGIGTSFYACKLGEIYFEDIAGITCKAEMSPEFRYKNPVIDEHTWVIALSQSGETKDTIEAIMEAKRKGALVTGIVNTIGSTISRITDAGVYNHIGPEISVASTKAFTSQSTILLMHAILLGRMRHLSLSEGKRLVKAIAELPQKIKQVLENGEEIKKLAGNYVDYKNLIFVAKKYNYPVALEAALKIKELSYIHAEGLSSGELKHGFIALIDQEMPTIAIVTKDSVYEKQLSSVQEILARNGPVLAVATTGDEEVSTITKEVVFVPEVEEELSPIINVIPLQFLAYYTSVQKGLDVDKPRNLAKSVTVE